MDKFPLTFFVPKFNYFSGTATTLLNLNLFALKLQIVRGSDGKAKMKHKKWLTSQTSLPEDPEGIVLLKGLPKGTPKV